MNYFFGKFGCGGKLLLWQIRVWGHDPTPEFAKEVIRNGLDNMGPKRAQSFIRKFYIFMSFLKIENLWRRRKPKGLR